MHYKKVGVPEKANRQKLRVAIVLVFSWATSSVVLFFPVVTMGREDLLKVSTKFCAFDTDFLLLRNWANDPRDATTANLKCFVQRTVRTNYLSSVMLVHKMRQTRILLARNLSSMVIIVEFFNHLT